jgi:hypothetical protein
MSRRIYFLLDFLVVAFFELFLAAFFFAMALSPPFVGANLRVAKIKVNVFLRLAPFFLDVHFALALIRASTQRARRADFTRAIHVRFAGRAASRDDKEFIIENTENTETAECEAKRILIILLSVSSVFSVAPCLCGLPCDARRPA